MNNDFQFTVRGRKVKAIYVESEVSEYIGNPLIEALPPILTNDEATSELSYYPEFDARIRQNPNHTRYHSIQNGLRFFSALDINLDLERRFSCLIRIGYTDRNPAKKGIWETIEKRLAKFKINSRNQYGSTNDYQSTAAVGFSIIGISGIGKSQTVERILKLYPQIIVHNRYKTGNFTHTQIVWLKLDCPFDGGIKGLCYNFFLSVDNLLGTTYFEKYAKKARNTEEMIPNIARVAANHFIGVLVIDEIQRLSKTKSGGAEKMLDFFVELVNTIGVPVVLVGTYKALPFLSGAISQMRRGSGQGDLVWDRMQFDEQWDLFIEDLWEFQYIRQPCSLKENPKLSKVLYEESQGITDLAIKLFMFSQELAITSEEEKLTPSIIRSAAKNKFNLLQPALRSFKNKDKKALSQFEDAYPTYLEQSLKDSNSPKIKGEVSNEPEIRIILHDKNGDKENNSDSEHKEAVEEFFKVNIKKTQKSKAKKPTTEGGLLETFQSVEKPDIHNVYEALKDKGFVKTSDEFIFGSNKNRKEESK
jgi:AAA domain